MSLRRLGAILFLGSSAVVATAQAAVQLVVSNNPCDIQPCPLPPPPPTSVPSRRPFLLAVVALDGGGSRDASYRGTVHFTSSDPMASLPSDYTFIPTDAGGKGFTVFLTSLGGQTITGTDNGNPPLSGTLTLTVTGSSESIPALSRTGVAVLAFILALAGVLMMHHSRTL